MIYFDNAATTHPKPEAVYERVSTAMREYCGNPGRSSHRLSMLAEREVFSCRLETGEMFGAEPENVIFTYNATYALNMAIKCAYESGSIIISDLEHNSVRRPARTLTHNLLIFDSHIELADGCGRTELIIASIAEQLSHAAAGKAILVCTAASNVCGATLPIAEIGRFCRDKGIYFIVDGAQAAGTIPFNLKRDNIDALCLPGHKGLYGPQGTGLLILNAEASDITKKLPHTFIEGGNGVNSLDLGMPDFPPERFEGGTLSVQNISGLRAGLEFVRTAGSANLRSHERALSMRFMRKLRESMGNKIKIYAGEHIGSIVLFNVFGYDSSQVADFLDARDICMRGGFHCSPLGHHRLGTGESGAVRASFGAFNTCDEVDEVVDVLSQLR